MRQGLTHFKWAPAFSCGAKMHFLKRDELIEFIRERVELLDKTTDLNPVSCSAWILHFLENIAKPDWVFTVPESYVDGHSFMLLYSDSPDLRYRTAATNYYASLFSPMISSADNRHGALDQLVRQLAQTRPRCAVINLAPWTRTTLIVSCCSGYLRDMDGTCENIFVSVIGICPVRG